jgi:aryl-alcohol dehydrogenase-like predicted oxidoreductase
MMINEKFKMSRDHWHCISPEFIKDQLTASLERMGLEKLDCYLLHNPEYCWNLQEPRNQFYDRIRRAFEQLETEVENGRIMRYGISSNSFINDPEAHGNVSLEQCFRIAEQRKSPLFHLTILSESGSPF